MSDAQIFLIFEQSVRINYETSRIKREQTREKAVLNTFCRYAKEFMYLNETATNHHSHFFKFVNFFDFKNL